ncbi:OmpA family protein [Aquifex sp.]
MKKKLILGMAGALLIAGCGTKVGETAREPDPCKDPEAALSNRLLDKCYGQYLSQILKNKEDIAKLNQRVSAVEADVEQIKREHEEIKAEIAKLKITGKEQVRVYFARNRYTLSADAKAALDELINAVKDKDIKKVIVVGYASKPGTRGYNLNLSMKRAQVVGAYLVRNGIPVEKIRIASYGEELADLIGSSRAEQRAVDVIVLY